MVAASANIRRSVVLGFLVFVLWRLSHLVLSEMVGGAPIDDTFLWDGDRYRTLFTSGRHIYRIPDPEIFQPSTAFFPLTAWIAKIFAVVLPDRTAMLVSANLGACGAFITMSVLSRDWFGRKVQGWALVVLALWPSSNFLWAFYSQSWMIVISGLALWAASRDRTKLTMVAAALAGLLRPNGIFVGAALVFGRMVRRRALDLRALAYGAAAWFGLGIVVWLQWRATGDPLHFQKAQQDWNRQFALPWEAARDGIGIMRTVGKTLPYRWVDLVALILTGLLGVWYWRRRPGKVPAEAVFYVVMMAASPLLTAILQSYSRYILDTWPLMALGGAWLAQASRRWQILVVVAMVLGTVFQAHAFANGAFAG